MGHDFKSQTRQCNLKIKSNDEQLLKSIEATVSHSKLQWYLLRILYGLLWFINKLLWYLLWVLEYLLRFKNKRLWYLLWVIEGLLCIENKLMWYLLWV